MEKFLKSAAIAWNPIGEARRRLQSGELTFGAVVAPFVGIVIACNLFSMTAQGFFTETLLGELGAQLPDNPLLQNNFAQQMMSTLGVLVPVGAVALLPAGAFRPAGRSATLAGILVVAAGWAFYGAALGAVVYFFSGALATVSADLGLTALALLAVPMVLAIVALTLFFWLRTAFSVLRLTGAQVAGISVVALIALGVLTGFMLVVASGSMAST